MPEISTEPGLHFGLGLEAYATWTSPIRKYGDAINHRLLKATRQRRDHCASRDEATVQMAERRRLNRMAERSDVADWLYARFLNDKAGTDTRFAAEIIDVSRGGMRVRLVDNGAVAFIPAPFLHAVRDELVCSQENGTVQIKGEVVYKVTDVIDVTISLKFAWKPAALLRVRRSDALHSGSCGNRRFFPLYPAISVAPIKVVRFFASLFHSFLASLISFVFVTEDNAMSDVNAHLLAQRIDTVLDILVAGDYHSAIHNLEILKAELLALAADDAEQQNQPKAPPGNLNISHAAAGHMDRLLAI